RTPPEGWPSPAAPFLSRPLEQSFPITSFFDHGGPFLSRTPGGGVVTYWGRHETDIAFASTGHDGWDYAAAPGARAPPGGPPTRPTSPSPTPATMAGTTPPRRPTWRWPPPTAT